MKNNYIYLLILLLLFIFSTSLDNIYITLNSKLSSDTIYDNYETTILEEYNELKRIYDIDINDDLNLIVSKIKYRNIYNFKEEITIYKGYKNNVYKGDIVLTDDGLVGVVTKTYAYTSVVTLITSSSSNISVEINEAIGILKIQDNELVVSDINNYESISIGDAIYTSGLGLLPKGIFVGTVTDIRMNNTEISQVVSLSLGVQINTLNYVYIWRQNA